MAAKLKASVSGLALGVALASGSAMAYKQGDMVLRAGAALVEPQEDSSEIALNGTPLSQTPLAIDSSVGVGTNTQLGLTFTYMLSNDVGVELLAATPFSHDVTANLGGTVVKAAEVKHLPPTLSVQYFPMGSDSALQPYVGVGLNYTVFFDEDVDAELDAVTTSLGLGNATGLDLDDSFGIAFELGCDYAISDTLVLNASIWKVDIDTTATFKYADGSKITADVDIDPIAYMLGVGYKF
jgi:outer membrane protein